MGNPLVNSVLASNAVNYANHAIVVASIIKFNSANGPSPIVQKMCFGGFSLMKNPMVTSISASDDVIKNYTTTTTTTINIINVTIIITIT